MSTESRQAFADTYRANRELLYSTAKSINHKLRESNLDYDDVMEVFRLVTDGFCVHCGSKKLPCCCHRDE